MGIKNLITLLSFLFVLFSCEKEEFEPEINQRTTFMYFPWSEDLIDYFYNNISDMEYAIKETSLKNERVIVFLSTSSIKAQMFEIILKNGNCIHSILKEYENIIRKTKCFDFWERNVLFPKTKRSFFRTPTLPFSA